MIPAVISTAVLRRMGSLMPVVYRAIGGDAIVCGVRRLQVDRKRDAHPPGLKAVKVSILDAL